MQCHRPRSSSLYTETMRTHFSTVDDYIASFQGEAKTRLSDMRKLIRKLLPNAEERISYNMPAYFIHQQLVVYFAGYDHHIGMYPGRTDSAAYNELAARYAHGTSTARFPHYEPLPVSVIEQFIYTRLQELENAK